MTTFLIVWFGQLVSQLGSALTGFALGVWIYQQSESATQYTLSVLFFSVPTLFILPFAGIIVDRFSHRWIMILSDLGAGFSTLGITFLLFGDELQIWHIYIANLLNSTFGSFQSVAYTAATTTLVSKEQLHRVGGLRQLASALAQLTAPVLAGFLMAMIQLKGILLVDFATFLIALSTLLIVRFPPILINPSDSQKDSAIENILEGINYVRHHKELVVLFIFSGGTDILLAMVHVLFTPLILSFASPSTLGILLSLSGCGILAASITLGLKKNVQNLMLMVLIFTGLCGFCSLAVGLKPSVWLYGLVVFIFMFSFTISQTAQQVIIQKNVELALQGRVLSLKTTVMMGAATVAYLLAGSLADYVFRPFIKSNYFLAKVIGQLIGIDSSSNIRLMFMVIGGLTLVLSFVTYQYAPLSHRDHTVTK